MPKLREAALVASVVGSVSMLGAGVAAAGGGEEPPKNVTITCVQSNGDNNTTDLGGLVTLNGPLISLADSRNMQNICGIANNDNDQTSGDANGGDSGLTG
ncbi:hypothetical protein [Streptomyces sp. WMMB 322]|uniref:hypothetical protein n=1 Tax=Streptomyces sp. WMMB 322 TaxID=1286821 RepID=UPI000823C27D|nr:hypothetical protein [Streptomyces sp. WMMB 322]SCK12262.1 hypothetical protein H180DRAFT_00703 [Streptomyces sp. WMMB 322]